MTTSQLDLLKSKSRRLIGVSCTASAVYAPEWVRNHPGKKVIVHRDEDEINRSLIVLGLPSIDYMKYACALERVSGFHIDYEQLFERSVARDMWDYLFTDMEFDEERHDLLVRMNVQPNFNIIQWTPEIGKRLMAEARGE